MKSAFRLPFLLGGVLLLLFSFTNCNKVHDIILNRPDCEVQQYTYSRISTFTPYLFQKRYDPSGKFLREISVTFNGVGIRPLKHFTIAHHQKKLLLINSSNPMDTTYSIDFNLLSRPQTITQSEGSSRFQLSFTYKEGRLDSIKFPNSVFNAVVCRYDSRGNVTSITHFLPEYGRFEGSFYEYDYSRTAKDQGYFEETTGDALHPLVLLRYLDLFPELNPTNIRTRSSTGLENLYYLSNDYLVNHQFDGQGKLLSYEASPGPGSFGFQVFVDWKCKDSHPDQEQ